MKVLLILVDGMRPDAITGLDRAQRFMAQSSYALDAQTVYPPVTLPCHVSLFHSVDPTRHGTTTNTYAPQVRPIPGLCEVLKEKKLTSAFFYSWPELRDLARPGSLTYSFLYTGGDIGYDNATARITDDVIRCLTHEEIDFTFCYMGWPDMAGHDYGWMGPEYMEAVEKAWEDIDRITAALPDMDENMRALAQQTFSKLERMTDSDYDNQKFNFTYENE